MIDLRKRLFRSRGGTAFNVLTFAALTFAALTIFLSTFGCASSAPRGAELDTLSPAAESPPDTAPPAARDALEEGLRWILEDAPRTEAHDPPSADGEKG